jgi:hypothetical protein
MPIKYDSPASVHKFVSRRDALTFEGSQVFEGTLKDCVRYFMVKSPTERPFLDMQVSDDSGLGKAILEPDEIMGLVQRNDFPKD